MRGGRSPLAILRTALLCVLLALGLGPEGNDAPPDESLSSATAFAGAGDAHDDAPHSLIEEALGHCHPGLDCAVSAIMAEPALKDHATLFDTKKFRSRVALWAGLDPGYDPPPPRPFV